MTTIVLKDGVIAADGQATAGNYSLHHRCNKLHVSIKHQAIFGLAGDPTVGMKIIRQIEHLSKLPWDISGGEILFHEAGEDVEILVAQKDGRVFEIGGVSWTEVTGEEFHGIGSGSPIAFGAMFAGADAIEAIAAAARFDAATGGVVRSFALKDIPARPIKKTGKK